MRDEIMAVKKELNELKKQSLAMEFVKEYKFQRNICFIMFIIMIIITICLLGYIIYLTNDTVTVNTTEESKQTISDIDTMNDNQIINGDYNGYSKSKD